MGENGEKIEASRVGSEELGECFLDGQRPEVGFLFCEVENAEGGDGFACGVPRNGGGWSRHVAAAMGSELAVRKNG